LLDCGACFRAIPGCDPQFEGHPLVDGVPLKLFQLLLETGRFSALSWLNAWFRTSPGHVDRFLGAAPSSSVSVDAMETVRSPMFGTMT
jgi:hypothetical protein